DLDIRHFVNADTIAAGLSAFAPETTALQAGRVMLAPITDLARQRQDFAFETTLASPAFAPFLRGLQQEGHLVQIIYVWLRTPELAVQRVAERSRLGGHHIPEEVVRRRYRRGVLNFLSLYRSLADIWFVCDNSGAGPVVVARGERQNTTAVFDQELLDEIE